MGQAWEQNYSNSAIIHTLFSTQTHHSSVQNVQVVQNEQKTEEKSEEKSEEKAGT